MRGLVAIVLLSLLPLSAMAETHEQPAQLPENVAYCTAGGALAALAASGIGTGPALIAIALCAIIVDDLRWHAAGNTHSD